ncbi:MAG: hypothetical protein QOG17_2396 [Gammaproteobacteria bacterium]|jgi:hypothetical protein|nr:hypothetical protein [Gammaproteobacteria bacterium]
MIDRRALSATLMASIATSFFVRSSKAQVQPAVRARNASQFWITMLLIWAHELQRKCGIVCRNRIIASPLRTLRKPNTPQGSLGRETAAKCTEGRAVRRDLVTPQARRDSCSACP